MKFSTIVWTKRVVAFIAKPLWPAASASSASPSAHGGFPCGSMLLLEKQDTGPSQGRSVTRLIEDMTVWMQQGLAVPRSTTGSGC
jgi:hypothetical protein